MEKKIMTLFQLNGCALMLLDLGILLSLGWFIIFSIESLLVWQIIYLCGLSLPNTFKTIAWMVGWYESCERFGIIMVPICIPFHIMTCVMSGLSVFGCFPELTFTDQMDPTQGLRMWMFYMIFSGVCWITMTIYYVTSTGRELT